MARFDKPFRACAALLIGGSCCAQEPSPDGRGTIWGRVVDAMYEPVPAATVRATTLDNRPLADAVTDGSGYYLLTGLPLGTRQLWVRAAPAGYVDGLESVTLTAEQPDAHGVIVRLYDAGTVRGRVVAVDGKPLAGALVAARGEGSRALYKPTERRETRTDDQGRFALEHVPIGEVTVRAFAPSHDLGETVVALGDTPVEVTLTLADDPEPRTLPVQVRGASARECAGINLSVSVRRDGKTVRLPSELHEGPPDAEGRWVIPLLRGLDYESLGTFYGDPVSVVSSSVDLSKRDLTATIELQVHRPEATRLRGRVIGPGNAPTAGATLVSASGGRSHHTRTDAEGRFDLESAAPVSQNCWLYLRDTPFCLDPPADAATEIEISWRSMANVRVDPDHDLELRAVRAARVTGQVVDADGVPVRAAEVRLRRAGGRRPFYPRITDRGGRFAFDGIRAPEGTVLVEVAGAAGIGASEPLVLEPGRTTDVSIRVAAAGVIEGTVVDGRGRPLVGVGVWIQNWDFEQGGQRDGSVIAVLTDRRGRYRHVGVGPGSYYVQVVAGESQQYLGRSEPFEFAASERRTLPLVVER